MNPYEKYQQQIVTTMTQGDLLLMLYDGISKQIDIARDAILKEMVTEMDTALEKAQKILRHLKDTLDYRYPISKNLAQLYDFFDTQLVLANIKKDAKPLDDIAPLIAELRETFDECDKIDRVNRRSGTVMGNVV